MFIVCASFAVGGCASGPTLGGGAGASSENPGLCAEAVVPEVEVSLDEVQAILEESGMDLRRLGRDDGAAPTLLVVQGEPKVLVSVNAVRKDVEMAVLYSLKKEQPSRMFETLNEVNRKLPCQVSATRDGNLLLESYLPYDSGLHVRLLSSSVRKFQTYSRICAVHLKDLIQ